MTKVLNAILVILMIAVIATFVVTAISLQNKTEKVLSEYSIRREELAGKQQQIQDLVMTLNSTIQTESEKQQVLSEQIAVTLKNINATLPNKTAIVTNQATTIAPPAPKPIKRVVVSSAS
ncbi:MAG: hypothetical protein ACP5N1_04910 [Candidatus Woesearchaeota archaeon]